MKKVKDLYINENGFVNFIVEPRFRLHRHIVVWIYLILSFGDNLDVKEFEGIYNLYVRILWMSYVLILLYFNMYVLVKFLLLKGRFITYIITIICTIIITFLLVRKLHQVYFEPHRALPVAIKSSLFTEIVRATSLISMALFSSTAIKLLQKWKVDASRINELEKLTLRMELTELKNQINPHFLFNMLNNVNVLVNKDPLKASLIILKLSDFLRYQLYENNALSVQLSSEIQFLNDFMELEKIRRDDFTFEITVDDIIYKNQNVESVSLPPGMLICFIENAIKYSIDLDYPSYVKASFKISEDKLLFTCVNSKPTEPLKFTGSGGLGLANVRRRLELLYGSGFILNIRDEPHKYEVDLTLPII